VRQRNEQQGELYTRLMNSWTILDIDRTENHVKLIEDSVDAL